MEGEAVWGSTEDDSQLLALYGALLPGVQGIFQGLDSNLIGSLLCRLGACVEGKGMPVRQLRTGRRVLGKPTLTLGAPALLYSAA